MKHGGCRAAALVCAAVWIAVGCDAADDAAAEPEPGPAGASGSQSEVTVTPDAAPAPIDAGPQAGEGAALPSGDAGDNTASDAGDAGFAVDASDASTASEPHRFSIVFDYRYDAEGYFDDPERRTVLQAAADTWGDLLRDDFPEFPANTPIGVKDIDGEYEDIMLEEAIDDLLLFVYCTDELPGINARTLPGALLTGAHGADFQAELEQRWNGPDHEPWAIPIAFNCTMPWFFDPTPDTDDDLPDDAADFYTTLVHEIGHALGFGGAQAYEDLRDGDNTHFLGPRASELYGGPVPLEPGSGHFENRLMFQGQRVLMDPGTGLGERDRPSALDLAALADIGYEIAE